jgi:translation initiation factor IF-1
MPATPRGFHLPPFVMEPEDIEEVALKIEGNLELGEEEIFWPIPTGFSTIDRLTGGGLHSGDLNIIGGVQNIGKTALMLQWAQHIASRHALALVVCYEHDTVTLWERLFCQSSFQERGDRHVTTEMLRAAYIEVIRERDKLKRENGNQHLHMMDEVLARLDGGVQSWANLSSKMRDIWLMTGDGIHTDIEAIAQYVDLASIHYEKRRIVLFVDYVQRVPVIYTARALEAEERIERVLAGLKGLAMRKMSEGIVLSVVAIGAADEQGLRRGRVHFENLWGNAIMQYEPDVAIIGNRDGWDEDGTPIVRWAVEKNRRGISNIEFKHKYHGAAYWFEEQGEEVERSQSWQAERDELKDEERRV